MIAYASNFRYHIDQHIILFKLWLKLLLLFDLNGRLEKFQIKFWQLFIRCQCVSANFSFLLFNVIDYGT